ANQRIQRENAAGAFTEFDVHTFRQTGRIVADAKDFTQAIEAAFGGLNVEILQYAGAGLIQVQRHPIATLSFQWMDGLQSVLNGEKGLRTQRDKNIEVPCHLV